MEVKPISHASQSVPQPPEPRTFWSACDNCKFQYEHATLYRNCNLNCPNCKKTFFAAETGQPEASGIFPWGPLDRRAAPISGVLLDLKETETGSGVKKRKRRVSVRKELRGFDFDGMLRERGRVYVLRKQEILGQK